MGAVVRLFFLMILTSIVLSAALGWFALMKAKLHFIKNFGFRDKPEDTPAPGANIIEGEYRVLEEKEK